MFTVAAVLPFLPLIEEAMIRQLGDDDFAKREAATRFLENVLRDTDGIRNYGALVKVKMACESYDLECKERAKTLYKSHREKYVGEHPYIGVLIRPGLVDNLGLDNELGRRSWKNIQILEGWFGGWVYNGRHGTRFSAAVPPNLEPRKLFALKNRKEVIAIVPLETRDQARDISRVRFPQTKRGGR
jgi:hypothetical protein